MHEWKIQFKSIQLIIIVLLKVQHVLMKNSSDSQETLNSDDQQAQYNPKHSKFLLKIADNLGFKAFLGTSSHLSLSYGEYYKTNFPSIISLCSQILLQEITLYLNEIPNAISELTKTNFTRLTELNLNANKIQSIEQLGRLNAPQLVYLNLETNLISNLRALRKFRSAFLKNLIINENKWNQLYDWDYGTDAPSLEILELYSYPKNKQNLNKKLLDSKIAKIFSVNKETTIR